MQYLINRPFITSQYIDLKLLISCKANEIVSLQLATWRPGRYEIIDFAAKIKNFEVYFQNDLFAWSKVSKSLWVFEAIEEGIYEVNYKFYANQMDAGGSWSDDTQLYINFSNCIFEIKERAEEPIEVSIDLPSDYIVASSLKRINQNTWEALNYQEIIDSPLLASSQLTHLHYESEKSVFHIWLNGNSYFDHEELIKVFRSFTKRQVEDFGEFTAKNYHFIIQLLPYKHYHGVEHKFSTVITIGPDKDLADKKLFKELIGVSSHELYHFWNVCRIRPKELLSYDLSKEVNLDSGFVLEGITTYMGDLYLLKSNFFSLEEYLQEAILARLQREFDNFGWKNQSIIESSIDLWLDGYKPGIPDKKVNIYNRGSLLAFCLDVMLVENQSSLANVMRIMWEKYGSQKTGYNMTQFINIISKAMNDPRKAEKFMMNFVFGKNDLFPLIEKCCAMLGFQINKKYESGNELLHQFGIRVVENCVTQIHPDAVAYKSIMINDKITSLETYKEGIYLEVDRYSRKISIEIPHSDLNFFPTFQIEVKSPTPIFEKWKK
ncbi:M61 family peptidase [Belliella kenyensis]|uniref:M61 family peptidase n=1 Tax=Belliella kenyensis TaxID=1472724 RepID=A0ABV8EIQ2_9BACT|nr:M61 family peptidase [Belliella kenyensis]MCH7403059.1 M61 family peptidase [Belliella kenyensis]MDN3602228.1 M61 family peptidase [Belliella kenyensis]